MCLWVCVNPNQARWQETDGIENFFLQNDSVINAQLCFGTNLSFVFRYKLNLGVVRSIQVWMLFCEWRVGKPRFRKLRGIRLNWVLMWKCSLVTLDNDTKDYLRKFSTKLKLKNRYRISNQNIFSQSIEMYRIVCAFALFYLSIKLRSK